MLIVLTATQLKHNQLVDSKSLGRSAVKSNCQFKPEVMTCHLAVGNTITERATSHILLIWN